MLLQLFTTIKIVIVGSLIIWLKINEFVKPWLHIQYTYWLGFLFLTKICIVLLLTSYCFLHVDNYRQVTRRKEKKTVVITELDHLIATVLGHRPYDT